LDYTEGDNRRPEISFPQAKRLTLLQNGQRRRPNAWRVGAAPFAEK
jgi:hypothetical protein